MTESTATTGGHAPPRPARRETRRAAALFVFCVLLTVIHTWPMALAPHRHSRVDNGDYLLNAWAIAWVSHQVSTDPVHLFDGNIFWPSKRALAFSEAMIVQGLLALPVVKLGGSPVLAFNLVMLAGFALTAFAFGLLAHRWTGSWLAALVAASAAGFNSHLLMRLGHLQAMHVEFLALVLFAVDRIFARQRMRDAMLLAVGFALQALTSVYLMTFTAWAAIYASAARLVDAVKGTRGRTLRLLALAAAIAVALIAFYLYAYYQLHLDQGFSRHPEENQRFAGSYVDYLSSGSRLHYAWSRPFVERCQSVNFPGVTVLMLVAMALSDRDIRRRLQVRMCLAVAAGCAATSFLPHLPGYAVLHRLIPLFWAVRVQAHLGQIVLLALALLAGYGAFALLREVRAGAPRWAAAAALVLAINAESLRAPIGWRPFDGIPAVYDVLAREPKGPAVELPMYGPAEVYGNARYMLNSTRHWQPLINGYSGFMPATYVQAWEALKALPRPTALEVLRARGVRYLIVHREAFSGVYGPAAFDALERIEGIRPLANDGDIFLYTLGP